MEEIYSVKKLKNNEEFTITVPGSKSVTNRALMLAALAKGKCVLEGVLFSDDSRAFLDCLEKLGFETTESKANFIFAKSEKISGHRLYERLKEKGVLVRHFANGRISDYNRITVGTLDQMKILLEKIGEILKEEEK